MYIFTLLLVILVCEGGVLSPWDCKIAFSEFVVVFYSEKLVGKTATGSFSMTLSLLGPCLILKLCGLCAKTSPGL